MSTIIEARPSGPLQGRVAPPGDKSISHRAILLAAMAQGQSRIENLLIAGVTRPMMDAVAALGAQRHLQGTTLEVESPGFQAWRSPDTVLYCGHSATTMRLLAGALAASGVTAVLDGSPGLRRRPMRRVVAPLQRMGVPIRDTDGHAPLLLEARDRQTPLRGGVFTLPVASAQVKSAILLAGLAAAEPVEIHEPGPSRDHTERMFRSLGIALEFRPGWVRMTPPRAALPPLRLRVPGDISSAAFLVVAALIVPGSHVVVEGVELNPTRTGLLDALQRMGARVHIRPRGQQAGEPWGDIEVHHTPDLRGIQVAGDLVVRMIDEFPIFAIAAAQAQGTTTVQDAEELRHKESDRIAQLMAQLRRLGIRAEERPDGFVIHGGSPWQGGEVDAAGDHRLAMALAVAGLVASSPVRVHGGHMFLESYPSFLEDLRRLGADVAPIA